MSARPAPAIPVEKLPDYVRTIADFPHEGIQFRDITTLIGHSDAFGSSVSHLARLAQDAGAEMIAGLEARGFVFGAAVAAELGLGFLPVRKHGKLPVPTLGIDYALEYGTDRLEVDPGAVKDGQRIVIVDDLVATGGTAMAATTLLRDAGARVDHALFVIDLPDLGGAEKLRGADVAVQSLMAFEGD